ncbi:MAG: hypothetical protein CME66_01315 [Halobacteriovoraceae bacterium]|nr:hypothetical protein [Halobacteriovoraceae bacterium]
MIFTASFTYAQTAYVPFPTTLSEGGKEFSFATTYHQTNSVVDERGEKFQLPEGSEHFWADFDLSGKYGLTKQLEVLASARARYIRSKFIYNPDTDNEEFILTRAGAESVLIGMKYSFEEVERTKYAIEGWYRQALYSNSIYDDSKEPETVVLGEGSREYALGVNFYYKTQSSNLFDGKIFYRSPGENLSHEVFSQIQYAMVWPHTALYLGIENVYSLEGDPYTNDPENKDVFFQGVSERYNSVNRQWTAPYLGFNFSMGKKWRAELQYAQIMTGQSTDLGPRFMVRLTNRIDKKLKEFTQRNEKFKEYRVESVVTKLSKSRKVAIIDKGLAAGVQKGMRVDFYYFDFTGGNELIASGKVIKVKSSKSLVRIIKRYSRRRVEEGTIGRTDEVFN